MCRRATFTATAKPAGSFPSYRQNVGWTPARRQAASRFLPSRISPSASTTNRVQQAALLDVGGQLLQFVVRQHGEQVERHLGRDTVNGSRRV
jgi:hypothetical protein